MVKENIMVKRASDLLQQFGEDEENRISFTMSEWEKIFYAVKDLEDTLDRILKLLHEIK